MSIYTLALSTLLLVPAASTAQGLTDVSSGQFSGNNQQKVLLAQAGNDKDCPGHSGCDGRFERGSGRMTQPVPSGSQNSPSSFSIAQAKDAQDGTALDDDHRGSGRFGIQSLDAQYQVPEVAQFLADSGSNDGQEEAHRGSGRKDQASVKAYQGTAASQLLAKSSDDGSNDEAHRGSGRIDS